MTTNKATILCTGELSAALVQKAAQHGIALRVIPFITIKPVAQNILQEQVTPLLTQPHTVVFTSVHAVQAVAGCLNGHQPDWKIYCISPATSREVEKVFGEKRIAATAPTGAQLAQAVVADAGHHAIIFFCGDQRREELPQQVRNAGLQLTEIVSYQTVRTPQKMEDAYDGIVFLSPSAVQSYFSQNTVQPHTVLFSIGPTTTATLQSLSGNRIVEAATPAREQLINSVINYFENSQ